MIINVFSHHNDLTIEQAIESISKHKDPLDRKFIDEITILL